VALTLTQPPVRSHRTDGDLPPGGLAMPEALGAGRVATPLADRSTAPRLIHIDHRGAADLFLRSARPRCGEGRRVAATGLSSTGGPIP
jgi:hypothetical protein